MRVYTGLDICENKSPTFCVHQCIMTYWIEIPLLLSAKGVIFFCVPVVAKHACRMLQPPHDAQVVLLARI
jgi:hypothetical protein